MDEIVTTGRTVESAIEKALIKLGKNRTDVDVHIERESSGSVLNLFGLGLARVRVRVKGTRPPQETQAERPRRGEGRPSRSGRAAEGRREEIRTQPAETRENRGTTGSAKAEASGTRSEGRRRGPRSQPQSPPSRQRGDAKGGRGSRDRNNRRPQPEPPHRSSQPADSRPPQSSMKPAGALTAESEEPVELRGAKTVQEATDIVRAALRHMRVDAEVRVQEDETTRTLNIELGRGASALIGRKGQTMRALEYLFGRLINGEQEHWRKINLDIDGYRQTRDEQLIAKARQMAQQVKADGKPLQTEPMTARDRRVFHMAIKEDPAVNSKSSGGGPLRRITVFLTDQEPPELAAAGAVPGDAEAEEQAFEAEVDTETQETTEEHSPDESAQDGTQSERRDDAHSA